jgi:hypothetical protein
MSSIIIIHPISSNRDANQLMPGGNRKKF